MSTVVDILDPSGLQVLAGDEPEFFAPATANLVDRLISEYRAARRDVEAVASIMSAPDHRGALSYFLEGNADKTDRRYGLPSVESLFKLDGALGKLNATYWSRALQLTDVYDCMPQKRRDEWNEQIREMKTPDFEEETVRSTLEALLALRTQFFAERIDGVFRGLSGEHVTNRPEGFFKRMILSYVFDQFGTVNYNMAGLINDLRVVVAKFMGRDEPRYATAGTLLTRIMASGTGEWNSIDGGALRVRVYKKGTAHLEVHPDMAWRLNQVLAYLYPLAIPAQHRKRPERRQKDFPLMQRPLPFQVLDLFASQLDRHGRGGNSFTFGYDAKANARAYDEASRVLELLGGTQTRSGSFVFDYPVHPVLWTVVTTGCVPDERAHQFYPTPERLGEECLRLAAIGPTDTVLEPSAGRAALAEHLPVERTTCVEISALNCEILRARGFHTVQADFLAWSREQHAAGWRAQRVVMNPPFANGRAQLHVEAAASLLTPGGRLVAILPASMRDKELLAGFEHTWSEVYDNEFAGTSVSVVILVAQAVAGPACATAEGKQP
ncbi:DUF4942 domain-containing protein [Ramlibacter sp. AN1133]|uniref:DUF4942 domain-containing protein n=1 Tax=Ramlibacter sp. AN1133 TaxID=3133429 RepID=UPI0030C4E11B